MLVFLLYKCIFILLYCFIFVRGVDYLSITETPNRCYPTCGRSGWTWGQRLLSLQGGSTLVKTYNGSSLKTQCFQMQFIRHTQVQTEIKLTRPGPMILQAVSILILSRNSEIYNRNRRPDMAATLRLVLLYPSGRVFDQFYKYLRHVYLAFYFRNLIIITNINPIHENRNCCWNSDDSITKTRPHGFNPKYLIIFSDGLG